MNQSKVKELRFWKRWEKSGAIGTITFNQQKHPEIRPGEVFITNADYESFREIGWETKRVGHVSLDNLGRPISQTAWSGSFPVFAQVSELAKKGVVIKYKWEAVAFYPPI
jgi:hypothetical protein